MDEPDWQTADVAGQFRQMFPFDSSYAIAPSEVRMTYDDRFIYVFAIMHNTDTVRSYVTTSLLAITVARTWMASPWCWTL